MFKPYQSFLLKLHLVVQTIATGYSLPTSCDLSFTIDGFVALWMRLAGR